MSMPQQNVTPPVPPAAPAKGSLGIGVAIAWACLIGGYVGAGILASMLSGFSSSSGAALFALLALAPWILMLVFAVRFAAKGQPRTAAGIGVGFASILGVGLLLVAACFGLLSGTNFH